MGRVKRLLHSRGKAMSAQWLVTIQRLAILLTVVTSGAVLILNGAWLAIPIAMFWGERTCAGMRNGICQASPTARGRKVSWIVSFAVVAALFLLIATPAIFTGWFFGVAAFLASLVFVFVGMMAHLFLQRFGPIRTPWRLAGLPRQTTTVPAQSPSPHPLD